jgi:hypothetical protein
VATGEPAAEGWFRRRFGRHPNTLLLVALLVTLLLYPPMHERIGSVLVFNMIRSVLLLAGLRVAFMDHPLRGLALGLAAVAIGGIWSHYFLPEPRTQTITPVSHLSAAAFMIFTVWAVLRSVFRQSRITLDMLSGALCGYLVVGVTFGHLYTALEAIAPGSFAGLPKLSDVREHFLLTYFSMVTLTTVGYGDITPATDTSRSLCILEAVLGQFYMAVLIAGLLGKWISQPANSEK